MFISFSDVGTTTLNEIRRAKYNPSEIHTLKVLHNFIVFQGKIHTPKRKSK